MIDLLILPTLWGMVVWCAFCILAGIIAATKHRSGLGYFLLSIVFTPLFGLIAIALLPALPPWEEREAARVKRLREAELQRMFNTAHQAEIVGAATKARSV